MQHFWARTRVTSCGLKEDKGNTQKVITWRFSRLWGEIKTALIVSTIFSLQCLRAPETLCMDNTVSPTWHTHTQAGTHCLIPHYCDFFPINTSLCVFQDKYQGINGVQNQVAGGKNSINTEERAMQHCQYKRKENKKQNEVIIVKTKLMLNLGLGVRIFLVGPPPQPTT